jgi:hypothetical protein
MTTGEPTYTYGSTSSGVYTDTFTDNTVYQVAGSASYAVPSQVDKTATGAPTYTYGTSTGGSYTDTQSDNGVYHVSTSSSYTIGYPTVDFRYAENGATNTTTSTSPVTDCSLSFTPGSRADYTILAFCQLKGSSTSYETRAVLAINNSGGSTGTFYNNIQYRIRSSSAWYDVAFSKRLTIGTAAATSIKIKFCTNNAGNTASIQFARILAFSSESTSTTYIDTETRTTTTSTSWQNKSSLTLTPVVGQPYIIFVSSRVDGSSTSYDVLYRVITNNGTVLMSGQKRPSAASIPNDYSVGLMRELSFSSTSDKIVFQYCSSSTSGTAGCNSTHVEAVRQDLFLNSYYKDMQGTEYTPAASGTWYDTGASITYTPAAAQHIIFGCMEEKAGSTTGYVQWRINHNGGLNNTDQLYEPNANDYECEWTFVRLTLTASSRTDKLQYLGSTTSARVRNPRILCFRMANTPSATRYRIDYYYAFQFTEGARADVTQLGWLVNGLTSGPAVHIYIYNWGTSQWDNTTLVLTSVEGDVGQSSVTINSYMDASGNMRIRYAQSNQGGSFTVSADYQRWRVNYNVTNYRLDYYYSFQFIEASRASVTQLSWLVNGKTSNPTVSIYLWNWGSSGWDDTGLDLTSVEADQGQASVTVNTYMDASGNMRIRYFLDAQASTFTVSVDYERWRVDYDLTNYRIDYYYSFQFTEAARADVTQLGWLVNGKTSGPNVNIYIYNWLTPGWDDTGLDLTSTEGDRSQSSVTINMYMDPSGNMRLRFQKDAEASSFTVSVDYERWHVEYNVLRYRVDYYYSFQFTEAAKSAVTQLGWTAEGKTTATAGVKIYLWNWGTSGWDDTGLTLTGTEGVRNQPSVSISNYMDASGNMWIRYELDSESLSFTVSVDEQDWLVHYDTYRYRLDYYYSFQFTEASRDTVTQLNWTSNGLNSLGACYVYLWDWVGSEWDPTSLYYTTTEGTIGASSIAVDTYMDASGNMRMRYQSDTQASTWTNSVDCQCFSVKYDTSTTKYRIDYYYVFHFTDGSRDNVTKLNWLVEGKTSSPTISIYLRDWQLSSWNDTTKDMTSTEATQSGNVSDSITTFMNTTCYMEIRFFVDNQDSSFAVSIDYAKWHVTYSVGGPPVQPPVEPPPGDLPPGGQPPEEEGEERREGFMLDALPIVVIAIGLLAFPTLFFLVHRSEEPRPSHGQFATRQRAHLTPRDATWGRTTHQKTALRAPAWGRSRDLKTALHGPTWGKSKDSRTALGNATWASLHDPGRVVRNPQWGSLNVGRITLRNYTKHKKSKTIGAAG